MAVTTQKNASHYRWQRLLIVSIIIWLGYQAIVHGHSQGLSERLSALYDSRWSMLPDALERIPPDSSIRLTTDAWVSLSEQALSAQQFDHAATYAIRGARQNLTNGRATAQIVHLYTQSDSTEVIDNLANLTAKLWPVHSEAQVRLTVHWLLRQEVEKAFESMNILMTRSNNYYDVIFPPMHELLNEEGGSELIIQYAQRGPSWWPAFFAYLAEHETDIANIKAYYQARAESSIPMTKNEQLPYINRLIKDKEWALARQVWLSTLIDSGTNSNALVYDGGFETDVSNEGFAWYFRQTPTLHIRPKTTGGISGKRALNIAFLPSKKTLDFNHVRQLLVLPAGNYQLNLRYRADGFSNHKGLQWRIRCHDDKGKALAESTAIKSGTAWQDLSVAFTIPPDNCAAQTLRLEAASQYAHDRLFDGNVWFDAIEIKPNPNE